MLLLSCFLGGCVKRRLGGLGSTKLLCFASCILDFVFESGTSVVHDEYFWVSLYCAKMKDVAAIVSFDILRSERQVLFFVGSNAKISSCIFSSGALHACTSSYQRCSTNRTSKPLRHKSVRAVSICLDQRLIFKWHFYI